MTDELRQKATIFTMTQFLSMPEAQVQSIAEQTDWHAVCQKCGAKLQGTLAQIKGHVCGS